MKLKGTGALKRVVVENKAPLMEVATIKPPASPAPALTKHANAAGDAGLSEAFAESHAWYQTKPGWMRRQYPNLFNYWNWVAQNNYVHVGG